MTTAYVVITNTDLTEGRGSPKPIHVCKTKATAIRLAAKQGVMGSDADVRECIITHDNGYTVGPVYVELPTAADNAHQRVLDRREKAYAKAIEAGLSDDDIRELRL